MLLPSGPISTSGNQFVDSNGVPVRIASVGWSDTITNYQQAANAIAADGFNCVRVSFDNGTLTADLTTIQNLVSACSVAGLKVIIDHHFDEVPNADNGWGAQQANGLWYDSGLGTDGSDGSVIAATGSLETGHVTQASFLADWQTVARAFSGNNTVIGYDLDNEPLAYNYGHDTSASLIANWGGGGPTDIQAMYTSVGNALQVIDSSKLMICEGLIQPGGPYSLSGVTAHPVVLNAPNKVAYSVHVYPDTISGSSVADSGSAAITAANGWGFLETQNVAPVWVGEIGASLDGVGPDSVGNYGTVTALADEQAWANTMVSYLNGNAQGGPTFSGAQQGVSTDWWQWNAGNTNTYAPDGALDPAGVLRPAQQAVYSQFRQEAAITVLNTTTNTPTPAIVQPYSYGGPVSYLAYQYYTPSTISAANWNVTASSATPGIFIHTGAGTDSIDVSAAHGHNILDGSTGSNFLTGVTAGNGNDEFYLDGRGAASNLWSTVVNFHTGDNATLWGIDQTNWTMNWIGDTQGAAGFTGLTGVEQLNSNHSVQVAVTLSGYHMADLSNGRLGLSYGQTPAVGGVAGSSYLGIHAN